MSRRPAPASPPAVLTVAGSDSGGGAGIQADLKTIEAGGAFGTSAITSVTAQHTRGVESTHVLPLAEIRAQCEAVRSDFELGAAKTGMLATADVVELVTDQLAATGAPVVVDPVMVAASGDRLLERDAERAYESLVAEAALVTPNADEAAVLTDREVDDVADARAAGEALVEMGADAALITGGHLATDDVVDVLVTDETVERLRHPRVHDAATHGSGCTLSAAIATRLAHGEALPAAVRGGVELLARAVRYHLDVGQGGGAVHHLVDLRDRAGRDPTAEAVHGIVERLVDADVSALVPEVGTNVVGATSYAESPADCAAVEGRITRTRSGVAPNRGVRFEASSHVARFLVAAREYDSDLRFAANCRLDEDVESALAGLGWPTATVETASKSDEGERSRAAVTAERAFADTEPRPVAVRDRGAVGREPLTWLVAGDAETLEDRILTLLGGL